MILDCTVCFIDRPGKQTLCFIRKLLLRTANGLINVCAACERSSNQSKVIWEVNVYDERRIYS